MRTMLFGRSGVADAKAAACRRADASSQNGTNAHSRPILHALGLGSWLATMLLYSNTVTPFQRYAGTQLFVGDFALQSLAFACLLSLTIAIVSWRGKRVPNAVLFVGCALYLLGGVAFSYLATCAGDWSGGLAFWVTPLLAVIVATGCVLCGMAWGCVYKQLDSRTALLAVAGAAIAAALLGLLGRLLLQVVYPWAFCLISIVAASLPVVLGFEDSASDAASLDAESSPLLRVRLLSFADVAAPALVGLLAFAFVMGTMRSLIIESYGIHLAVLALCGVVLLLVACRRPVTRGTCRALIPTLAVLQLASANVTATLWGASPLDMFMIFLLYTMAALLTLSTLSAVAHAEEFPCDLLFSVAFLLFSLASLAGITCSQIMNHEAIKISTTLITTVYAFAMVMTAGLGRRGANECEGDREGFVLLTACDDGSATRQEDNATTSEVPLSFDRRCVVFADRFHLTAREREILLMLVQGCDSASISESLYISQNTVRSHIHNLCHKTGADGRTDLLKMVLMDDFIPAIRD